eukprot:GDKJ01023315.1.p1 GENE.GDKJ01023315.1~~GDKJ01023315.1.p1  ORF type:complete len:695 (-),score=140.68 GDKJ01023315.1:162-1982(-)
MNKELKSKEEFNSALTFVKFLIDTELKIAPSTFHVKNATVPVLKILDRGHEVCDITINNTDGVENSRLVKLFCDSHPMFAPLCRTVKKLCSYAGVNDRARGTLSTYTIILMVAYYLQTAGQVRLSATSSPPTPPELQFQPLLKTVQMIEKPIKSGATIRDLLAVREHSILLRGHTAVLASISQVIESLALPSPSSPSNLSAHPLVEILKKQGADIRKHVGTYTTSVNSLNLLDDDLIRLHEEAAMAILKGTTLANPSRVYPKGCISLAESNNLTQNVGDSAAEDSHSPLYVPFQQHTSPSNTNNSTGNSKNASLGDLPQKQSVDLLPPSPSSPSSSAADLTSVTSVVDALSDENIVTLLETMGVAHSFNVLSARIEKDEERLSTLKRAVNSPAGEKWLASVSINTACSVVPPSDCERKAGVIDVAENCFSTYDEEGLLRDRLGVPMGGWLDESRSRDELPFNIQSLSTGLSNHVIMSKAEKEEQDSILLGKLFVGFLDYYGGEEFKTGGRVLRVYDGSMSYDSEGVLKMRCPLTKKNVNPMTAHTWRKIHSVLSDARKVLDLGGDMTSIYRGIARKLGSVEFHDWRGEGVENLDVVIEEESTTENK